MSGSHAPSLAALALRPKIEVAKLITATATGVTIMSGSVSTDNTIGAMNLNEYAKQ